MKYSLGQLFAYGLFGMPLALVALPVYVMVPQLYAASLGMPLATVGAVLLAARVLDAFIDPPLGRWIDRARQSRGHAGFVLLALPLLLGGFVALFYPPDTGGATLIAWFGASLVLVYLGYSIATIAHNSWGASLTQERGERSRLTAVREACALAGVVLAAALPTVAGMDALTIVFALLLLTTAALLWRRAPRIRLAVGAPASDHAAAGDGRRIFGDAYTLSEPHGTGWLAPLAGRRFRWLFAIFAVNGIAAAIPATLFLFFASDRLQLPQHAGSFLLLYFGAAAITLPLWSRLAARIGEARAWLYAMVLAIMAFAWTATLGPGDLLPFALVCAATGAALGADLALPPALLAGVIGDAGHAGAHEGSYFGLWSWMTKMNLALAAGIALPLLGWLGYAPGTTDEGGLAALSVAYALLPCALKAGAALLLWKAPLHDV